MTSRIKLFLTMIALWPSIALAQNSAPEVAASEASLQSDQSSSVNEPENEMLLVCDGSTFTVVPTSQTNALVTDSHGNMVVGSATSSAPANVRRQVQLRIKGGSAEMQVPELGGLAFLFIVNAGWYKVKNLIVGGDEISGKVRFGAFDSSKFRIDRRTGSISLQGVFSGNCRKEDLQKRAF